MICKLYSQQLQKKQMDGIQQQSDLVPIKKCLGSALLIDILGREQLTKELHQVVGVVLTVLGKKYSKDLMI